MFTDLVITAMNPHFRCVVQISARCTMDGIKKVLDLVSINVINWVVDNLSADFVKVFSLTRNTFLIEVSTSSWDMVHFNLNVINNRSFSFL